MRNTRKNIRPRQIFATLALIAFFACFISVQPALAASTPTPTPTKAPTPIVTPAVAPPPEPRAASGRLFTQTGFRVKNAAFLDFFDHRGGARTFGYPVSREFTLGGFRVQFFQRGVMQLRADGSVTTMNILDPGLMPYTQLNGANFPASDKTLTDIAPTPGKPGYATAILNFVKSTAPEDWQTLKVGFYRTFFNTVSYADVYGQKMGDSAMLPGFNLELWGIPTSKPAFDPNNKDFVYIRFQRGIMHYDKKTGATQGILLADYLKAIITGQNLPPDLEAQAKANNLYKQYDPSKPKWLARPAVLPNTDLTQAFEPEPLVVIDAGHGGREVGSAFTFPDGIVLREKDLNLQVANRTAAILTNKGYRVVQTRTKDAGVNPMATPKPEANGTPSPAGDLTGDKKVDLSDELQARIDYANIQKGTLFLSTHLNGSNAKGERGAEVYYCQRNVASGAQSKRFADLVQKEMMVGLRALGADSPDRGAKDDERSVGPNEHLYVLGPDATRPIAMPAILAEPLFLSNAEDAALLRDPKVIEAIAQSYARAIISYNGD